MKKLTLAIVLFAISLASYGYYESYAKHRDVAKKYVLENDGDLFRVMKYNGLKCQITSGVSYIKTRHGYSSDFMVVFKKDGRWFGLLNNNDYDGYYDDYCPKAHKRSIYSQERRRHEDRDDYDYGDKVVYANESDSAKKYILKENGDLFRVMKHSGLKCQVTSNVKNIRIEWNRKSQTVLYFVKKESNYIKTYALKKNYNRTHNLCPSAKTHLVDSTYMDKDEDYYSSDDFITGIILGAVGLLILDAIFDF